MKTTVFEIVRVEFMPNELEQGKLYLSKEYKTVIHACACGCETRTVTPIDNERHERGEDRWWGIYPSWEAELISIQASILNKPCNAHYYITNNQVV